MTVYTPPLADIRFTLRHVAGLDAVAALPGLEHATPDLVDAVLEEAGRLAADVLAPTNREGDRHGAVLENGVVRTAPGFKEAYARFAGGGWMGTAFPQGHGGQDLPWLLNTALAELWNGANLALQLAPLLTQGAVEALLHHGSDAQKALYLQKLISGTWTGAMCLTEPQAGTDVGALRTRAVRHGEHYRIFGQKIWITFGEHDMAENIAHFVLARLDGAPAGTRGISLFIVPKYLPKPDGSLGRRNDWRCIKLEEKLGIHGSPTCTIAYGDDEGAVGFLLGQEKRRHALHVHDDEQCAPRRRPRGAGPRRARLPGCPRLRPRADPGPDRRPAGGNRRLPRRAPHAARHARADRRHAGAGVLDRRVRRSGEPCARDRCAPCRGRPRRRAHARGQGVVHRPRGRDRPRRRPGAWRHGVHRGDRGRAALPRRQDPLDLRGAPTASRPWIWWAASWRRTRAGRSWRSWTS